MILCSLLSNVPKLVFVQNQSACMTVSTSYAIKVLQLLNIRWYPTQYLPNRKKSIPLMITFEVYLDCYFGKRQ